MDYGQLQRGVSLPLANGWQDADLAIPEFEECVVGVTVAVSNLDAMPFLDRDLVHLVGHGVIAVACSTVHAGPQQEVRAKFMGQAEELVDITLPIADMHASGWTTQKLGRLRQIVQPADAFLRLDRNPRRVDLLLERRGPFELLSCPQLNRGQADRHAIRGQRQARMHQNAADRMSAHAAGFVASAVYTLRDADRLRCLPLEGELCRVVQHEDPTLGRPGTLACRLKVPRQDIGFVDALVGQEAVSRLGVGPVLTGKRYALPHRPSDLAQQLMQPPCQALVGKVAVSKLTIKPCRRTLGHRTPPESVPDKESHAIRAVQTQR